MSSLPFEGSGAIGQWRLELPVTIRQFDYGTISDAKAARSSASRLPPT